MAGQVYEPIAPVNTNINGDDANKFAVKYKKEIDHIYSILRNVEQGGGVVVVDDALSESSQNPVQNKAITARLGNMYTKAEITKMLAALSGNGSGGAYGDPNSYKVTITQSAHQTIKVRKYYPDSSTLYTATFTASEPFWNIEVSIESDVGYVPGDVVVNGVPYAGGGTFVLDRDFTIYANEALPESVAGWTTTYINGSVERPWWGQQYYHQFSDRACTQRADRAAITGKLIIVDVSNGYPADGQGLIGTANAADIYYMSTWQATEIRQNINTSKKNSINQAFYRCYNLRSVDLSNWNLGLITTMTSCFGSCNSLEDVGDISRWNMPELMYAGNAFSGCSSLKSIDLHGWYTPNLINCEYMFDGCTALRAVDISGLETNVHMTSCYRMFNGCSSLKYIIMDRDEVMFQNHIFDNPNSNVKYLVPSDLVSRYKNHSNWAGRSSMIHDIANFTITRYNGHVEVSENV